MAIRSGVGFFDRSFVETYETFRQMCEHGELLDINGAKYIRWAPGERLELWTRVEDGQPDPLFYSYYAGEARMRVALIDKTPRSKPTLSDGAIFCRSQACAGDGWIAGRVPFVFDTPDFHRYDGLSLPRLADVQLTAFAFGMKGYEDEDEFDEDYPEDENGFCWNYKHFVPVCMLEPRGEGGELQPASTAISGIVVDAGIVTNPITDIDFCRARVETIGGEVDVVCAPDKLEGYLVEGGIAASHCYLYGRLVDDKCN
jgi:hypothetical protein